MEFNVKVLCFRQFGRSVTVFIHSKFDRVGILIIRDVLYILSVFVYRPAIHNPGAYGVTDCGIYTGSAAHFRVIDKDIRVVFFYITKDHTRTRCRIFGNIPADIVRTGVIPVPVFKYVFRDSYLYCPNGKFVTLYSIAEFKSYMKTCRLVFFVNGMNVEVVFFIISIDIGCVYP